MLVYISSPSILFFPYLLLLLLLLVHLVKPVPSSLKIKLSPRSLASTMDRPVHPSVSPQISYSIRCSLIFPPSPIHFLKKLRISKFQNSEFRCVQIGIEICTVRDNKIEDKEEAQETSQYFPVLNSTSRRRDVDFIENFYQESIFFFFFCEIKIVRNITCVFCNENYKKKLFIKDIEAFMNKNYCLKYFSFVIHQREYEIFFILFTSIIYIVNSDISFEI